MANRCVKCDGMGFVYRQVGMFGEIPLKQGEDCPECNGSGWVA